MCTEKPAVCSSAENESTAAPSAERRRATLLGLCLSIFGIAVFSTIELNCKWLARMLASAGATPIDGFMLCFQRFFWTGLILIGLFWPAFRKSGKHLGWRDMAIFALNGAVGISISISLYQFAVATFENASSAAVVFSSNALFTIIFARWINGEPWTVRKWLAVFVGMTGIGCFLFEKGTPNWNTIAAIILMWGSALTFACSVCITRRVVANYGGGLLMGFSSLFGSILVLPFALLRAQPGVWHSCCVGWLPLTTLILAGTALGYYLYYSAMKYISAYLASMSFLLKPVLACLLAVLLAGEHMNRWTILGTAVILCSLLVSTLRLPARTSAKRA